MPCFNCRARTSDATRKQAVRGATAGNRNAGWPAWLRVARPSFDVSEAQHRVAQARVSRLRPARHAAAVHRAGSAARPEVSAATDARHRRRTPRSSSRAHRQRMTDQPFFERKLCCDSLHMTALSLHHHIASGTMMEWNDIDAARHADPISIDHIGYPRCEYHGAAADRAGSPARRASRSRASEMPAFSPKRKALSREPENAGCAGRGWIA